MTFVNRDRRAYPDGSALGRWPARDGWSHRCFDWPAESGQARGSILFQGGRGDIFEKYLEVFGHWHDRGWAIRSFDWRGQGGSGRLTERRGVGHAADFAPFVEDLADFAAQWWAETPGPHVMIAHSMGGHLLLRALAERRIAPDAAVLVAPMLGLASKPFGAALGARIARLMCRIGDPERPAWKANERPAPMSKRQSFLTHCLDRYADELWWKASDPSLETGPPSWGWLRAAYASTADLERPGRLEGVTTPVLLIAADADQLVDARATHRAAARLPNARLLRFGAESAHEILRELDPVRLKALDAIDSFLDEAVPAG